MQTDTFRHQGLRKKLIESIRKNKVVDENVLHGMENIPRHLFADKAFASHLYEDKAFPIDANQTISQPTTVAIQTTLLKIKPTDIILEIGTGSGYQTLLLAKLGKYVLTMERMHELYRKTKQFLPTFQQKNIEFFYGDGYKGLPNYAPFDKILVTAAAPEIPEPLVKQLKPGGRMVIPVNNDKHSQTMYIIEKNEQGEVTSNTGADFLFVPMLKGTER